MQRFAIIFFFLTILSGVAPKYLHAADGSSTPATRGTTNVAPSAKPETVLELGVEERVRLEDFDNTGEFQSSMEDMQQRTRFRTKIWARWTPTSSVGFYLRIGNEFKKTSSPTTAWGKTAPDEGFIDNLYLDFKKVVLPGLSLRVGRQDLTKAEGFLLTDFTSGDGSRSTYMNGFDLGYSFRKSNLHLLGVAAPKYDHYLPRINDSARCTNETDNSMIGLYYESRNRRNTDVDVYWLYNSEVGDYRAATSASFTPDRHLSTLGGRLSHKFRKTLTGAGEFAFQRGRQHSNVARLMPDADIRAWGGYAYVRKDFDHEWKPFVQIGEYLYSGDDYGTTGRAEGFDPLFGRWPAKSELLSYGLQKEKGFAYFSNMRMTQLQAGFAPVKPVKTTLSYQRVDAFHPYSVGASAVFGSGTHRGDLLGMKTELTLNDHWKGHVTYEWMLPGDFYVGNDHAHFFRVEAIYTFKKSFGRK